MRFRWIKKSSRAGCVTAAVTRVLLKGMEVDTAIDASLSKFSVNSEGISEPSKRAIKKEVERKLTEIGRTRRSGSGASG